MWIQVPLLSEFYPRNPALLGLNINGGGGNTKEIKVGATDASSRCCRDPEASCARVLCYPTRCSRCGAGITCTLSGRTCCTQVRLRPHGDPDSFLPEESVLGTLLHELVHNVQVGSAPWLCCCRKQPWYTQATQVTPFVSSESTSRSQSCLPCLLCTSLDSCMQRAIALPSRRACAVHPHACPHITSRAATEQPHTDSKQPAACCGHVPVWGRC